MSPKGKKKGRGKQRVECSNRAFGQIGADDKNGCHTEIVQYCTLVSKNLGERRNNKEKTIESSIGRKKKRIISDRFSLSFAQRMRRGDSFSLHLFSLCPGAREKSLFKRAGAVEFLYTRNIHS